MKFFCKGHIALAIASGAEKAEDGNVIIAKAFDKECQWSGCATRKNQVYSMHYEGMKEMEETPAKTEDKSKSLKETTTVPNTTESAKEGTTVTEKTTEEKPTTA